MIFILNLAVLCMAARMLCLYFHLHMPIGYLSILTCLPYTSGINNALNSDNLKPEIAEKLLQLRKKPTAGGGDGGAAQSRPAASAQRPGAAAGQPPKKRPKTDR